MRTARIVRPFRVISGILLSVLLVFVAVVAVDAQEDEAQDRQRTRVERVTLRELVRNVEQFEDQPVEVRGELQDTPVPGVYTLSARDHQVYVFAHPGQVPRDLEAQDGLTVVGTVHEVTRRAFSNTFDLTLSRGEARDAFPIVVIVADQVGEGRQDQREEDQDAENERDQTTPVVSYEGTRAVREARCLGPEEQRFLELINDYREEHGLNTLDVAASLNAASWKHSLDMATRDYFSHRTMRPLPEGLPGPLPRDRMAAAGYDVSTTTGENIAAGPATAEAVFEQWTESPRHNEIMLDPRFEVIGIGRASAEDSRFGHYWTTDFGGQEAPAPDC